MESEPAPSDKSLAESLPRIEFLLQAIIRLGHYELGFTIQKSAPTTEDLESPEYTVDFSGPDADSLLEKNAALLDALEHVVVKAARVDEEFFGKVSFDCQDWRRMRNEELRMTAQVAAERVIETGDPFALSPMNPRERRIIHLALKDNSQVHTQSEGRGSDRRVVISPSSPPRPTRR